jgi:hypothetical protein
MTDQEKYAEKIAALLRKAESTTPEEAELLFEKAAELMEKYKISEAMLNAAKPEVRGTVQRQRYVTVNIWRFPVAEMKWRIAKAMGLQVIKLRGDDFFKEVNGRKYKQYEEYEMFGFESDLRHFEMIITSLEVQMLRAELAWWEEHKSLYAHESKAAQHKYRRGFMFGFAQGAAAKYAEVGRKAKQEAIAADTSGSTELVLRDKSLEIADAFKKAYPLTISVRDRMSRGDMFAHGSGDAAGRKADIGNNVGSGNAKQLGR